MTTNFRLQIVRHFSETVIALSLADIGCERDRPREGECRRSNKAASRGLFMETQIPLQFNWERFPPYASHSNKQRSANLLSKDNEQAFKNKEGALYIFIFSFLTSAFTGRVMCSPVKASRQETDGDCFPTTHERFSLFSPSQTPHSSENLLRETQISFCHSLYRGFWLTSPGTGKTHTHTHTHTHTISLIRGDILCPAASK